MGLAPLGYWSMPGHPESRHGSHRRLRKGPASASTSPSGPYAHRQPRGGRQGRRRGRHAVNLLSACLLAFLRCGYACDFGGETRAAHAVRRLVGRGLCGRRRLPAHARRRHDFDRDFSEESAARRAPANMERSGAGHPIWMLDRPGVRRQPARLALRRVEACGRGDDRQGSSRCRPYRGLSAWAASDRNRAGADRRRPLACSSPARWR